MNFLLAVAALNLHLEGGAHALPITSRPIEGNAQRMAWDEWLSLPLEQKSLEKEKKVTAKSIFTLPFRHCPPGHTLYNEHCIPQINIDPADLLKQELIYANAGAPGSGSPTAIITDYDYSEDGSEEVSGDELLYDLEPQSQQTTGEAGGEDQALPSADAPLKFNIFEKKFPTGPALGGESSPEESPEEETARLPPIVAATATATTDTATTTTPKPATTTTATPNPKPTPSNRIPAGGDLQAASSNALSTTSSNIDIGNIAAIVVPAGGQMAPPDASSSSVLLVTSSLTTADSNADANESGKTNASANPSRNGVGDFKVNGNAEAEADLAQLLKVDAFLPAYEGSSIELLPPPPPFNHRRVAPPLSADQDDPEVEQEMEMETEMEEETTTDIVDVEDEATTDTTETTSSSTSTSTSPSTVVEAETTMEESSSSSSSSSSPPSPAQHPQTHQKEEPEIDEGGNRLLLIKSKVQPVQVTAAAAAAATSSTTSTQSTTTTIEAETQEAAATEHDRFHYQQIPKDVVGTATTEIPASSSSSSSSISSHILSGEYPLLDKEAEEETDNLMTNTIGGEINVDEELRKINELVKGTRRLLQQQRQQQQTSSSSSSSTEASSTSYATESSTNWSKLMPQATATTTTETTAKTAATESTTSTSAATATATATSTTAATSHLSINTNRSNRNSKIIRVAQAEGETTTVATSTAAAAATTTPNTNTSSSSGSSSSSSSKDDDEYTPFWWLPNIGWRLDRQVDRNGEDRALLLRFFSTFRAGDGAMASTLPPRR
ncbi:GL16542 [Drosophila persimilis]|uniref:GL16542 n=1 Tax=Drosophila persimilis TaxID=7234 RepID=B4GWE9_DROPE|nr:GL16542 [Drosophila persimilis]